MRILSFLVAFSFFAVNLNSQVFGAADPCTDGTQETCECETSPILCTINDLNGFEFDMDTFEHPDDGPEPMCPPPDGNTTTSHNPTWFAFIAWCEDLTLEVTATDCVDGPACVGSDDFGVQAAVFKDCSLDPNSAIACDTDIAGCEDDFTRTLDLIGMTIGNTYYFLVDGCCSSACHIEITVIGDCGVDEIGPWDQDIDGPIEVGCSSSGDTGSYSIEAHPGAIEYHWSVDGVEIESGTEADGYLGFDYTFPGAGTYEICVDVSNKPCIEVYDEPDPLCIEVMVCSVVPVNWIEFKTIALDYEILLTWATRSGIQNNGFEVQRSTDAIHFVMIGFVEGVENSVAREDYKFVDKDLKLDVQYFYRLEQQDLDGSVDYSIVKSAIINKEKDRVKQIRVLPNPNDGNFVLRFDQPISQNATYQIIDMLGRVVKKGVINQGVEKIGIYDLESRGTHLIKLQVGDKYLVKKLLIL